MNKCPVREAVTPTPGAAAGDRSDYSQFGLTPCTMHQQFHTGDRTMAAINFRGVDQAPLSGRQVNEMRERDMEEYTKRQAETEITDWGLAGLRG